MTCDGFFTFDRQAALIDHVDLNRVESRQPGRSRPDSITIAR